MRARDIRTKARETLSNRWGLGVLATIIMITLTELIPRLFEIIFSGGFSNWYIAFMADSLPISATITFLFLTIIFSPVYFSTYAFYLDLIRKKDTRPSHLFRIFQQKFYWTVLSAKVLMTIYLFFWSLLLVIPGIIKNLSYSQTYFILKDNPSITANQAITRSRELMDGFKTSYFFLLLSFVGWGILAIFTLGIGFIWLIPYMITSQAAFYQNLVETDSELLENTIETPLSDTLN
jgi:uncharacterized membrane protein